MVNDTKKSKHQHPEPESWVGDGWGFHVQNFEDELWYTGAKRQWENPIANNAKCKRKGFQHLPIIIVIHRM